MTARTSGYALKVALLIQTLATASAIPQSNMNESSWMFASNRWDIAIQPLRVDRNRDGTNDWTGCRARFATARAASVSYHWFHDATWHNAGTLLPAGAMLWLSVSNSNLAFALMDDDANGKFDYIIVVDKAELTTHGIVALSGPGVLSPTSSVKWMPVPYREMEEMLNERRRPSLMPGAAGPEQGRGK